jgi:hypothetical protein
LKTTFKDLLVSGLKDSIDHKLAKIKAVAAAGEEGKRRGEDKEVAIQEAVRATGKGREDRLRLVVDKMFRRSKGINEGSGKVNIIVNTSMESISRNQDDQQASRRNYTLQSHRRNMTIISNR